MLISLLKINSLLSLLFILLACGSEKKLPFVKLNKEATVISAPAELVSLQEINLTPPNIPRMWEFKIEYLANENSLVNKGDILVKFDGQGLKIDLLSKQSELDAIVKEAKQKKLENEARLEQLILDLAETKKNKSIAKRKVEITDVSRSRIERKKQQAEFGITTELYVQAHQRMEQHKLAMKVNEQVQAARISKAQSRVDEIEDNIKKLQVTAPSSGMVMLVHDSDNKKPSEGDTVYMGRRLITLPALDNIAVKVEFDESYTPNVVLGRKVQITLDAFPERSFTGYISELGKAYRNKSQHNLKIVFDAWITLEKLDLSIMRPGMKATVVLLEVVL